MSDPMQSHAFRHVFEDTGNAMEGGWSQQDENDKRNVIQLQAKQARIEDHEKGNTRTAREVEPIEKGPISPKTTSIVNS
ncbi:hypothetical protein LTR92_002644 [Exophiala xenobiotica]|nr:hypothetical protein LTR92_002644 [Exophiala xenobiotica]